MEISSLAGSLNAKGTPHPIDAMALAGALKAITGRELDLETLAKEVAHRRELTNMQTSTMELNTGNDFHTGVTEGLADLAAQLNSGKKVHAEVIHTKPDAAGIFSLSVILAGDPKGVEAAKAAISKLTAGAANVRFSA